ncbi:MAG: hypothetical protein MK078_06140 [Crocinitomicaceae bacterium]|nr:hypothetical protein [Crocinitomicaceae bacterium]
MKAIKFLSSRIIYLLLLGIIAVFAFILANLSKTVEVLCKEMVHKSLFSVNFEMDNCFNPIKEDLIVNIESHENRTFYLNDFQDFNQEFEAIISNKKHVSSILLATIEGDEYMLMDADSCWVTRSTFQASIDSMTVQVFWSKEDGDLELGRRAYPKKYDPRERPWFINAKNNELKELNWTDPYEFFTTKEPGITISTAWQNRDEDRTMITAFDVLLSNISDFTSSMEISDNGYVFVLTQDGRVIGVPANSGFDSKEKINDAILEPYESLGMEPITQAMKVYSKELEADTSFRFLANDEHWWGDVEEYEIGGGKSFIVGVVVPESDFVETVIESRNFNIIGFIIILIITVFLIKVYRDKHQKNALLAKANEEITHQKQEIEEKRIEIMDSINYAKRIQQAILSPEQWMEDVLGDSFVMYLPKDIVAGDFYWVEPLDNGRVLFAAADCNGHGVPRAMVSVVCHMY